MVAVSSMMNGGTFPHSIILASTTVDIRALRSHLDSAVVLHPAMM